MSLLATLRTAIESPAAIRSALRALEEGRGPVAAAKAFAASTSATTDDAAAAWLVEAARTAVRWCDAAVALAAHGVELLEASRPGIVRAVAGAQRVAAVVQTMATWVARAELAGKIDRAVGGVLNVGYRLIGLRATFRRWLDA